MSVEQYRMNIQFLEGHAEEYPFSCRTKKDWPRPEMVYQLLPGTDFVCAPLGKEREWRFTDRDGMRRFKTTYTTLDNKE